MVFEKYARYYDLIYKDKDYRKECDFIEQIFQRYSPRRPTTILEMACGTGRHAKILSSRNYKITAFDNSEEMISIAKERNQSHNLNIDFSVKSMQDFTYPCRFDAALAMFTALGYLPTVEDLRKTLVNLRKYLKRGSLFIFDIWNGDIVPQAYSTKRIKEARDRDLRLIRLSTVNVDPGGQQSLVNFRISVFKRDRLIDEFEERHKLRFYRQKEIKEHLNLNGFRVIKIVPFLRLDDEVTSKTWDICLISQAK